MTQKQVLDYLTKLADKIDRYYADAIDNAKTDYQVDALASISTKRAGAIEQVQWLVKEFGDAMVDKLEVETPLGIQLDDNPIDD